MIFDCLYSDYLIPKVCFMLNVISETDAKLQQTKARPEVKTCKFYDLKGT